MEDVEMLKLRGRNVQKNGEIESYWCYEILDDREMG
jgi:hypothetical protein